MKYIFNEINIYESMYILLCIQYTDIMSVEQWEMQMSYSILYLINIIICYMPGKSDFIDNSYLHL